MAAWLISRAIGARIVVLALAAGLVFAGALQSRSAQTDVLPEFSPPYVEVQTEALGLSAEEVEQLITAPMENLLLNGVAFLDGIRSESVNGLSSITLIFEPGTDLLDARQVVQERLTQAKVLAHLPEPPAIVQPLSSASRVLVVGLASDSVSPIDMSVLARWTVRPKLLGVAGVANVSIFGQRERQLQVQVDPKRLARLGVTLQEVINTSGNALWVSPLTYLNASSPGTGGFVDTPGTRLEIRHVSPITASDDLAKVALERTDRSADGAGMTLGDVATVTEDHQPLIGDAVVGDGPGLIMVVEKLPGANTVEVTEGVEDALATLAPGLEGISVETNLFRPATFVDQARDNYLTTVALGLLLAGLLALLLLLQLRAVAVVVCSAAVSVFTTLLVLDLLGMRLDGMVLAGLALATGVVVQDSVIDVENITRRLRERPGADLAPLSIIRDASLEMRRAMGYATAIVLVALVPLLVVNRLSDAFFRPAIEAFAAAALISMVIALTVTPALCALLLRGGPSSEPPVTRWLSSRVEQISGRTSRSPRAVLAVLGLGVVAGALVLPIMSTADRPALMPDFKESDLVVSWRGEPGTSRTAMTATARELGAELRAVPGVRQVGGHVGRAVLSDRVNGISTGELWVGIDTEADYAGTVAGLRTVIEEYDGAQAELRSYYSDRIDVVGGLMSGFDRGRVAAADDEVVVRIYGEELPVLVTQSAAIERNLSSVDGVTDVRVELPEVEPNVEVEVDLAAAERYALKPGDIRRAATTLATGLKVGSLFEEQKVFDVVVTGSRDYFGNPERIGDLLIDTPDGGTVRLDQLADVKLGTSFTAIGRESVSRRLDLVATVSGDRAAVSREIEEHLEEIEFPLEYHAEVIGDADQQAVDLRRMVLLGFCALIALILILQASVGSWRLVPVALGSIGFSLVGGVVAVGLAGGEVTIGTVLGFVVVLALAVRNLLGLLSHYHHMRVVRGQPFGADLICRGAGERARATLLTGTVTAAVMLPVALAGSRPGLEIIHPMALVVIGGAVTATIAPLFLVPALYLRWGEQRGRDVLEDDYAGPSLLPVR